MNNRKWTWVLSLAVALGIALGGVGAAAAAPGIDHLPQTKTPTSGKFVMSGSISSSGQTIPLDGSGAFSGENVMLDLALSRPEGVTSGPEEVTLGAVALDNKLYFKAGGIGAGSDQWYVVDLNDAMSALPGSVMGMPGSMADLEAMIHSAVSSKEVGKEAINGVPTTKYQLDVDVAKVASATGQPTEGLENTTLSMTLWVGDEDMYVHQFTMAMGVDTTSGDIAFSLDVELMMTFSDLDKPVTITAPAGAQTIDAETLAVALSGLSIGGNAGPPIAVEEQPTVGMPRTGSGSDSTLLLALMALGMGLVLSGVAARRVVRVRDNK